MKIAIICYFSNESLRNQLPLDNRKLYRFMRRLMRLPVKEVNYGDYGPWCTALINAIEKRKDVELHVITAHPGLTCSRKSFQMGDTNYHVFPTDKSTLLRHLIPSSKWWERLNPLNGLIRSEIAAIKPDIINLIGAENSFIASSVLGLEKLYPILVTCQTIYNNPDRIKYDKVDAKASYVERLIFQKMHYYGIANDLICCLSGELSPGRVPLKIKFPASELPNVVSVESKEYDFVNFALSMTSKKGFTDSIEALAIVRKTFPEIKLNLTGGCNNEQKAELDAIIKKYGLEKNVSFTPFFPEMKDLFLHIQKSRFALLPCKLDFISSTLRQAMYYGLPAIAYETSGTPSLNEEKDCVLLAKNSDVEDLASKMLDILSNEQKAELLRKNARDNAIAYLDNSTIADDLIKTYDAVIENYRHNKSIPKELLWKEEN